MFVTNDNLCESNEWEVRNELIIYRRHFQKSHSHYKELVRLDLEYDMACSLYHSQLNLITHF